MRHRSIIATFLTLFIVISIMNSYIKTVVYGTELIYELVDIFAIIIRIIISLFLTHIIVKHYNKSN